MKKSVGVLRCIISSLFFTALAVVPAHAWRIPHYEVTIQVESDSRLRIEERITADFGSQSKHGIYRDIPAVYTNENGEAYAVRFDVRDVRDAADNPRPYIEENERHFKRIKIGSPDRTITGEQIYVIRYDVAGAVIPFPGHDEIYWNAIGPLWEVPIGQVRVIVDLPQAVNIEELRLKSFTGRPGSKTTNAGSSVIDGSRIIFQGYGYPPGEGFTVVVGLPKGMLTVPAPQPTVAPRPPVGRWALILPLLTFIGMTKLWQRYGKDPQLNKSVVVEYKAPVDLRPGEIGTLIDNQIDQRDITATIIDLAIHGYLKITQEKGILWRKDYVLTRSNHTEKPASYPLESEDRFFRGFPKPPHSPTSSIPQGSNNETDLKRYERVLLERLFQDSNEAGEVRTSQLKNTFYVRIPAIKSEIETELKSRHFLRNENASWRRTSLVIAFGLIFVASYLIPFDGWLALAVSLSAAIIALYSFLMPQRTIEGIVVLSRILGFKEFLMRTDGDKIQRADRLAVFERMLPYAIALGMNTQWARKFEGIYKRPPQWFAGDYSRGFRYSYFIRDLDRSLTSIGSNIYSAPQSVSSGGGFSGGGSSGGGFGGGGADRGKGE